ncbi:MAG: AMP-binding protein [Solirubrobacteraceae bacterium]|nr:AMP-binding protein [Solirubrobacteraceae bacterium]
MTTIPPTFVPLTVADGIRVSTGRTPHKIALREGDRTLTYLQLRSRVHRVGNAALHGLGLTPGDHVAILSPNRLEYPELVIGLAGAGLAAATVSPRATLAEMSHVVGDSQARALFADPRLAAEAEELGREHGIPVVTLGEGYEAWLSSASDAHPGIVPDEWDTMVIHYTSGTTGEPKGVLCPHRSRTFNYLAMAAEYGSYGPRDHGLTIAPMYHGAGLSFTLANLFLGGSATILTSFEPERVLAALAAERITNTFMVPTHFHGLFGLGDDRIADHGRCSLKTIVSNAAPLSQAMKERIVGALGEDLLFECYGSTEGGVVSNLAPADQLVKERSVGLPFPATEIKILGDDGRPVQQGEVGELFSRSPYLFVGYQGRPEATAETLRDGWFSAGDLARQDEEGYIYLVDRKGDKIITGGLNVYPREVEELLARHPLVGEAAVFGIDDARWGEAIQAVVTIDPSGSGAFSEDDIIAFCREHLSAYKVPKQIEVTDSLPRNAAGKVLRRVLRDARKGAA